MAPMPPLRGRDAELAAIGELLSSALGGKGSVALVEGPAGIGKTRLLSEAARIAQDSAVIVAAGAADQLDQVTPWGPLLAALSSTEPPLLVPTDLTAVRGMLDRRLVVPERIRAELERAASTRPLLVTIDDIQWADPATVLALGSLPQQLFSYPIVWILGRRPMPTSAPMQSLVDRLVDHGALRLSLGPLQPGEALKLAADLLGVTPDRSEEALVSQAGGNPFYLVEVLRGTRGGDPADLEPPSGASPGAWESRTLHAAIAKHLRSLSEPAHQLIKVASVLGPTFAVAELSAMTGQPAGSLLAPIEETLTAGVLVAEANRLAFGHDLLRRAVYDDLPTPLRPALHRDAAAALLSQGAPLARVASHLAIGAQPGDEKAIEVLIQTVDELFGTSPTSAADLALRVLDLIAPADPRRPGLVAMAVRLLGWASQVDDARTLGEQYLAEHAVSPQLQAEIHAGMRRAWSMRTLLPYPVPLATHLASDPTVAGPLRANLIEFEQVGAMWDRPMVIVAEALQRAAEIIAASGNETDLATWLAVRVTLDHEHGMLVAGLETAQSKLPVCNDTPGGPVAGTYQTTIGSCLITLGRPREALEVLAGASRAATATGYTVIVSRCRSGQASALLELGRLDDARAEARAAAELADEFGYEYYLGQALATLVETCIHQGDLRDANAAAEDLISRSPLPTGDHHWVTALIADARGRPETGLEALRPVLARLARNRFLFASWCPSRLPKLAHITLRADSPEATSLVVRAAEELAHRNPGAPLIAGIAAHVRGLGTADIDALRDAVELFDPGEAPLTTALAHEDLGRALMRMSNKDDAVASFDAAYSLDLAANAQRDLTRVRSALHSLGVRRRQSAVARPQRGWASLTNAELAVCRLVAQGNTNREAAAQLFVSPETVNTHLRHAFTKLGVHSRVELGHAYAKDHTTPKRPSPSQ